MSDIPIPAIESQIKSLRLAIRAIDDLHDFLQDVTGPYSHNKLERLLNAVNWLKKFKEGHQEQIAQLEKEVQRLKKEQKNARQATKKTSATPAAENVQPA